VADAPDLLDKKPSAAAAGLPIARGGVLASLSWLGSSLIVYFMYVMYIVYIVYIVYVVYVMYFVYFMYVFAIVVARVERLAGMLGAQSTVRMWRHHR
jgi:apolipoprotein N-acyltransferase